jgi:hypothetical protein
MRWAARVIGLLISVFLFVILIGEGITEGWDIATQTDMVAGILIGVLGVIGLTGCIISWWREWLAAILLFLTAVGFGIHIGFYAGRIHFLVWSTIGFPYLLAAVLLISSRWLSKKPI